MKKHLKEIIVIFMQMCAFYIGPLANYSDSPIGFMLMLVIWTFVLSVIMGSVSEDNYKWIYPFIVAILFIPSVFFIYNSSALIYVIIHFIASYFGVFIGMRFKMKNMVFAVIIVLLLCIGGGCIFSGINKYL